MFKKYETYIDVLNSVSNIARACEFANLEYVLTQDTGVVNGFLQAEFNITVMGEYYKVDIFLADKEYFRLNNHPINKVDLLNTLSKITQLAESIEVAS